MKISHAICSSLLLPAALGGLSIAGCAFWLLGNAAAAGFVIAGCLMTALGSGVLVARSARRAGAQLRHPELRSATTATGIYRGLIEEAIQLLEEAEAEAAYATRARTELEARMNVRSKQMHRLENALNCLDQPLLITDARDQPLFCNTAALKLFGPADDRADDSDSNVQPDLASQPQLKQLLAETRSRDAATGQRSAELEFGQNGTTTCYRTTAVCIHDADGSPLGVVTALQDIGEEQKEKTRHAEFVSSVCHELKTPMAGIKAYTEMLIDGDVTEPDERHELYEYIELQVDRLTRLVNNMLNLTRIESGVIKIQREDCGLNEVLQKAVDVVRHLAEEKQLRLSVELSDLYLPVHVDKDLFSQAAINLLSNAMKYTPEGGAVRLRSRLDENQILIEVFDTGMGIPQESLPHIFDRFYRVPENNKAAAGTGLGLSLVNYIVTELHNGSIAVDSTVGEGTTFTLSIPLGHRNQNQRSQPVPAGAC